MARSRLIFFTSSSLSLPFLFLSIELKILRRSFLLITTPSASFILAKSSKIMLPSYKLSYWPNMFSSGMKFLSKCSLNYAIQPASNIRSYDYSYSSFWAPLITVFSKSLSEIDCSLPSYLSWATSLSISSVVKPALSFLRPAAISGAVSLFVVCLLVFHYAKSRL